MSAVKVQSPALGLFAVCEPILRSLPDRFGTDQGTALVSHHTSLLT